MGRKSKKPKIEEFEMLVTKCGGNLSNVAKALNVTRKSVWEWMNTDKRFADVVEESRKQTFDACLQSAKALALGIPDYQYDEDGTKRMVGWLERPDPSMLRYFMSTLGKDEGFGESVDITSKGESIAPPIKIVVVDNQEELKRLKAEDEARRRKLGLTDN